MTLCYKLFRVPWFSCATKTTDMNDILTLILILITCHHDSVVSIQNPEPLTQNYLIRFKLFFVFFCFFFLISDVLWWWQSPLLVTGPVEDVLEHSVASAASMRWSSSRTSSMFSTLSKPSEITRLTWWRQWWDSCTSWTLILNRWFLMCWHWRTKDPEFGLQHHTQNRLRYQYLLLDYSSKLLENLKVFVSRWE